MTTTMTMATATEINVTLASTLLDTSHPAHESEKQHQASYTTGIKRLDRELHSSLWSPGKVIGVGVVQNRAREAIQKDLALELIATHLLTDGRLYMLLPPSSGSISLLYSCLRARLRDEGLRDEESELRAMKVLDKVSVLQYLDLIGLSESISEASGSIGSIGLSESQLARIVVYVEGLGETLDSVLGRIDSKGAGLGVVNSRINQYAALLNGIVRNIRSLVRVHARNGAVEVLMLVGIEADGNKEKTKDDIDILRTAFADEKRRCFRMSLCASENLHTGRSAIMRAAEDVFVRILEDGLDTIVLVHDGFRQTEEGPQKSTIVEVVKDVTDSRDGATMGSWALRP